MSSFQDLRVFRSQEAQKSNAQNSLSLCLVILRSMRVTLLGVCPRVIVNENPLNLEKTTSSVLSVISINLWQEHWRHLMELNGQRNL